MKIAKGMKVTLKVDLSVAGGQQLEKNQVEFVYGSGAMLSGLETVLLGLEKGAKREGTLKAKDAFGNSAMHPLKKMKRTDFPKELKLEPGEKLVAKGVNDMNVIMKVEKVSGDEVEVRLVHPLAEKDITYAVEVVSVRSPPPAPPPPPTDALELTELEEDK
ncbi:MAG: peptidylprolyl isomerase [Kofleriaceae bacterium]